MLNEKVLKLATTERRAMSVERAQEMAQRKAEDLQGKLREAKIKIFEAISIVLTRDKELADLKEKTSKQVSYNMGFKDAKNSVCAVIIQAQRFGFSEGWMAAVNAIGLPESSTFRDTNQIPLPSDPPVDEPTQEQPQDDRDEEEGEDSPSMVELAQQIDSHVMVIDVDNLTTTTATEVQSAH